MSTSRIPPLASTSEEDARAWFLAMREAGLLFNLHDDATWIVHIDTNEPFFTDEEAEQANAIHERLVDALGDRADDIVYPIFMETVAHLEIGGDEDLGPR
ncbi:hypothetical protein [Geopseudomonas aromaticivorans]